MVVRLMYTLPGRPEPQDAWVAQNEHSDFVLHKSASAAHAEETQSEDWPAVLPTKQPVKFSAWALKGFVLRMEDGWLRAYRRAALLRALYSDYHMIEVVGDEHGNVTGGKLRRGRLASDPEPDAATLAAAQLSAAEAVRMLEANPGAVKPLRYADMGELRRMLERKHAGIMVLSDDAAAAVRASRAAAARAAKLANKAASGKEADEDDDDDDRVGRGHASRGEVRVVSGCVGRLRWARIVWGSEVAATPSPHLRLPPADSRCRRCRWNWNRRHPPLEAANVLQPTAAPSDV